MVLSFKPLGLPAHLLPRAFRVPQIENTPINVPNYTTVDKTLGFSPPSPKTTNCDKQRLLWEHICVWWQQLNFTDYQATLLAVGPLCMLPERCPRMLCMHFRPGGAKERQRLMALRSPEPESD